MSSEYPIEADDLSQQNFIPENFVPGSPDSNSEELVQLAEKVLGGILIAPSGRLYVDTVPIRYLEASIDGVSYYIKSRLNDDVITPKYMELNVVKSGILDVLEQFLGNLDIQVEGFNFEYSIQRPELIIVGMTPNNKKVNIVVQKTVPGKTIAKLKSERNSIVPLVETSLRILLKEMVSKTKILWDEDKPIQQLLIDLTQLEDKKIKVKIIDLENITYFSY